MDPINRLAAEYRLTVIEDAAQAIGAEYLSDDGKLRRAGTMSTAGSLSFYPSKNLGAAGDAGAIICHDDELAERFRIFRQHGMEPRYFHHVIGGNFRLDAIQAAILKVKLPYLDRWSTARRQVADSYREEFDRRGLTESGHSAGRALPGSWPNESSHLPPVCHSRAASGSSCKNIWPTREIGSAIYYPLGLHEQKCFALSGLPGGRFAGDRTGGARDTGPARFILS